MGLDISASQIFGLQALPLPVLDADPDDPREGQAWIRQDLSPLELRCRLGGVTLKAPATAV